MEFRLIELELGWGGGGNYCRKKIWEGFICLEGGGAYIKNFYGNDIELFKIRNIRKCSTKFLPVNSFSTGFILYCP